MYIVYFQLGILQLPKEYQTGIRRPSYISRAVGAGQAGQAVAWPLFGHSLGKGRQECSCTCAMEVYLSSWCNSWTVCEWFIALHTYYSSSLIVVGCEPDHHIFASYGPASGLQLAVSTSPQRFTGRSPGCGRILLSLSIILSWMTFYTC